LYHTFLKEGGMAYNEGIFTINWTKLKQKRKDTKEECDK
jgi:hypothetical protein